MVDVKSLLLKKSEKKAQTRLVMKDVNRDLLIALLAIPVYGKDARDEEILSVIINAGHSEADEIMARIRAAYDEKVAAKKIKKLKGGAVVDDEGYYVLVPRR